MLGMRKTERNGTILGRHGSQTLISFQGGQSRVQLSCCLLKLRSAELLNKQIKDEIIANSLFEFPEIFYVEKRITVFSITAVEH
jgi:hypothetical protein